MDEETLGWVRIEEKTVKKMGEGLASEIRDLRENDRRNGDLF